MLSDVCVGLVAHSLVVLSAINMRSLKPNELTEGNLCSFRIVSEI